MRVAYFTAGTVGAGHLVRGIALGEGLRRAGFTGVYRMFGPALPFATARRPDYQPVTIRDDPKLRSPTAAGQSELARQLTAFAPDLLLVDLFWAPLRWVLPGLACPAWLLVRTVPPAWFVGPAVAPFDPAQFTRIVAIEPLQHAALTHAVDPVVICNPDECRPPDALRQQVGADPAARLVVVMHAGRAGEHRQLEAVARAEGDHVVRMDLFTEGALFPAARWLGGADHIVCGVGYNAFWEARWLGYAPRVRFLPFGRRIDDQANRLHAYAAHPMRANGADTLARWMLG